MLPRVHLKSLYDAVAITELRRQAALREPLTRFFFYRNVNANVCVMLSSYHQNMARRGPVGPWSALRVKCRHWRINRRQPGVLRGSGRTYRPVRTAIRSYRRQKAEPRSAVGSQGRHGHVDRRPGLRALATSSLSNLHFTLFALASLSKIREDGTKNPAFRPSLSGACAEMRQR